ncbi:MAG: multidrug effflux MFS transporter [Acidobacteriota bacterium]
MSEGQRARFVEFVALMATLVSLVALSIDAMLPALGEIGRDLGVERENQAQLVVTFIFLGIAVGQLAYGPLADSVGRKPALLCGLSIYLAGSALCLVSQTFPVMLVGRLLQGLGAAGPRIVTLAIIRDRYEGRRMAQVISFVTAVFIIVPLIAPAMGQAILLVAGWRAIFGAFLVIASGAGLWFWTRQEETLPRDHRTTFTLARIGQRLREVLSSRAALGYTITAGFVFSPFLAYLSTAQQVFEGQYGLGRLFPMYFAVLALAIGVAALSNTRLVMRFGMERLVRFALRVTVVSALIFFAIAYAAAGQPPLVALVAFLLVVFFCQGILFGNLNALAMAPLGRVAGIGAAVVGTLSMVISIVGGTTMGQAYDGTVLPLVAGYGLFAIAALGAIKWADPGAAASSSLQGEP